MAAFERTDDDVMDGGDPAPGLPELVELLEERDAELNAHGRRVADHAERTARIMGLPAPAIGRVRVAGRLHDLGKVWIPREILDKPGPLTDAEWGQVRRHPQVAARLFQHANLHELADIVLAHHERPDAAGYPDGIPSCEAPLEAQIVAVGDVYDAMVSWRPYAAPRTPTEARGELERVASTQLDENVVEAFLRMLDSPRQSRSAAF